MPKPKFNNKMFQEKVKEASATDQDIIAGRKAALIPLIAFFAGRLLLVISEFAFVSSQDALRFQPQNLFMLVVVALFAIALYSGIKAIAYLALAGVALSVIISWEGITHNIQYGRDFGDGLAIFYSVAFIIAMLTTLVPMVYLLVNKKYRAYANKIAELRKECTI